MAHYVKQMVDQAVESLDDKNLLTVHRFKQALDREDYMLNRGAKGEISAKDLLWQNYWKYDQLGHAYLALLLWGAVVCHPKTVSATFRVGGSPVKDRGVELNNTLLAKACGPFTAEFWGGYGYTDGNVTAAKSSIFKGRSFPLQVGAVSPGQLMFNLLRHGCFARWPYGSECVYVFQPPTYHSEPFNILRDLIKSHIEECTVCKEAPE